MVIAIWEPIVILPPYQHRIERGRQMNQATKARIDSLATLATKREVIHYVNNSTSDLRSVWPYFQEAYKTGVLHEDISDVFTITILKGYNPDGSDRMLIDAA